MDSAALQQSAYSPAVLQEDHRTLKRILSDFFTNVSTSDWDRNTEKSRTGWTLRETLVHIASIAEVFDCLLEDSLTHRTTSYPQYTERSKLLEYNTQAIAERLSLPVDHHIEHLFHHIDHTMQRVYSLSSDALSTPVKVFVYNRPLTALEVAGAQLAHPGITHAAQLANAVNLPPLWTHYTGDMLDRQFTRFLCSQMSVAYSGDRDGKLRPTINMLVGSKQRGTWQRSWHMVLRPDGGTASTGYVKRPKLTFWTPSTDALCRLFTLQMNPLNAILRRQLVVWGDLGLALRMGHLFL
jgi:hypothetical protein